MSTPVTITTNRMGIPDESIDERLIPRSTDKPEQLVSRLQNAKQITARVTPVAQGMYSIQTDTNEYIINIDSYDTEQNPQPACLCDDFIFRASNDGFDCKHALLIKYLIVHSYLPPVEAEPTEWIQARLDEYHSELKQHKPDTPNVDDHSTYFKAKKKITNSRQNPYNCDLREVETLVSETIHTLEQNEAEQSTPNESTQRPIKNTH